MTISIPDYALMAGNAYRSTRNPLNWTPPFPEGSGWEGLAGELDYRQDGAFEATGYKNVRAYGTLRPRTPYPVRAGFARPRR